MYKSIFDIILLEEVHKENEENNNITLWEEAQ